MTDETASAFGQPDPPNPPPPDFSGATGQAGNPQQPTGPAAAGYPQAGYPQAGYPQAGYPQAGYPQAGYGQPETPPWSPPVPAQPASNVPNQIAGFDPKTVSPLDWGIIGAGALPILFSFFSYYTYSIKVSIPGLTTIERSTSYSAWHGFFGWFAALVALAGAVLLATHLIAKVVLPFPVRLVALGSFGLATLCILLALVIVPGATSSGSFGFSVDKGHGFGYWLSLLSILAATGLSFVRLHSGQKLPGRF
jgi:hypothetical protein